MVKDQFLKTLLRLGILALFFVSVAAAAYLYIAHRPDLGRWFLLTLALAWYLRLKHNV